MKKSYHSIVVPIALASATRRASIARSGVMVTMRASAGTAGLGTSKIGRVFDTTRSLVPRLFGIRTKRACAARPRRAVACRCNNAFRRGLLFHPVHKRRERIELIGCGTAGTMVHSRDCEQPHELLRSTTVHAINFGPPVHGVFNGKYGIADSVHNQKLAATLRKRCQICRAGHHEIESRLSKLAGFCCDLHRISIDVDSEQMREWTGTGARNGGWRRCEH